MSRIFLAIAAALVATIGFVVLGPARDAQAAAVRIMPLGDSITGSPGCWRALLWNRLQSTGYTNIDFVGTLPPQGCGVAHDGDNEGHGGFLATNVADQNQLPGWLSATRPDVVLMHFGTNDVWSARSPETILAAFSKLVDQMRASNANMKILVAKIIPLNPSSCGDCASRAVALNNAIPAWAGGKTTAQSPIVVVDQWTGFNTSTDTYDGVHPNAAGDQKMSDKWYPALTAQLTPGGGDPSTTPTPGLGCTAAYRITNSWGGGFQGEVTVTAGSSALQGWRVTWTYANGQTITQLWNGSYTSAGGSVSVSDMSYNGSLAAGTSTSFGFTGTQNGTNPVPSVSCAAT